MFSCEFCEISKNTFLQNTSGRLLLPMDHHVKENEEEKIEKYKNLAAEVRRQFRVKTVIVSIVLRAFETVPAKLSESLEKLKTEDLIGSL